MTPPFARQLLRERQRRRLPVLFAVTRIDGQSAPHHRDPDRFSTRIRSRRTVCRAMMRADSSRPSANPASACTVTATGAPGPRRKAMMLIDGPHGPFSPSDLVDRRLHHGLQPRAVSGMKRRFWLAASAQARTVHHSSQGFLGIFGRKTVI